MDNQEIDASAGVAVLHVALNPVTGPWGVMRNLAAAQASSGRYSEVAIGVIVPSAWPKAYADELAGTGLHGYRVRTIDAFGTGQFIWQRFQRPPIGAWVEDLINRSGANHCVVHFHNAWMSGVFLPLKTKLKEKVTLVATFHGVNAQLEGRPIRRWLHRWMAERLPRYGARLTSVDAANLGLAERLFGLPSRLFRVIPNGVSEIAGLRCNEWKGRGEFRVGHVGSITERKGWRVAAEAVLALRQHGLNARLLVAGTGSEESQVREMAQLHGEAIEYLGHVADPRLNLLPRLHALAVMSAHEGLPMTIVEALSIGLPVAATAVGGIPEAVTDGISGALVNREVEALAQVLARWHGAPEIWSSIGAGGYHAFQNKFKIDHIVDDYHRLYNEARTAV